VVYRTGLENRSPFTRTVGSNPTPSAASRRTLALLGGLRGFVRGARQFRRGQREPRALGVYGGVLSPDFPRRAPSEHPSSSSYVSPRDRTSGRSSSRCSGCRYPPLPPPLDACRCCALGLRAGPGVGRRVRAVGDALRAEEPVLSWRRPSSCAGQRLVRTCASALTAVAPVGAAADRAPRCRLRVGEDGRLRPARRRAKRAALGVVEKSLTEVTSSSSTSITFVSSSRRQRWCSTSIRSAAHARADPSAGRHSRSPGDLLTSSQHKRHREPRRVGITTRRVALLRVPSCHVNCAGSRIVFRRTPANSLSAAHIAEA
jgi:hypothetical protein